MCEAGFKDLTLTSVVFELILSSCLFAGHLHLTLTSVVFEFSPVKHINPHFPFNFNKCCI